MMPVCCSSRGWLLLVVAVAASAPYLSSLQGGFVFDDHEAVESNLDVRTNTRLSDVFSNDFWGLPLSDPESHKSFRPLTTLSFRLNRVLHGMWPPGFHLVNVGLHALVSVLFLLFCLKLDLSMATAVQAALLFAVHPIHTEAVANVVGRTEPLSAVFYLLALLSYQQSNTSNHSSHFARPHTVATPHHSARQTTHSLTELFWISLTVLLSFVSMLCKEQGITVLGVCAAYEVLVANRLDWRKTLSVLAKLMLRKSDGERDADIAAVKSIVKRTSILAVSCVVMLAFRLYINGRGSPFFNESDNPAAFSPLLLTRLLTFSHLVALNLWLLLCPSRLCFDWSMGSIPLVESLADGRNVATAAAFASLAAVLLVLCYGSARRRSCDSASHSIGSQGPLHSEREATSFSGTHSSSAAPHNGHTTPAHSSSSSSSSHNGSAASQNGSQNGAQNGSQNAIQNGSQNGHRSSSSSSSSSSRQTLQREHGSKRASLNSKHRKKAKEPPQSTSFQAPSNRERTYRLSLFGLSLLALPFLPASNLVFPVGFVLAERVLYLPSMGLCLLVALGMAALLHTSQRAVKQLAPPLFLLLLVVLSAKSLVRSGEWSSTLSLARAALPVNPTNAKVYMTIGNELAQQGNRSCELFYRQAVSLRPSYTAAWTNLGLVLLNTDRPQEAERCYRKALLIKPDHVNANTNLAHLCRLQRRWREAATHYATALQRRPSNPLLHYHLALATEHLDTPDHLQQAEQEYEAAIALQPLYWEAHSALAELLTSAPSSSSSPHGKGAGPGKKRIEKAIAHLQKSLQLKPDNADAHYKLGKLMLYGVGAIKEAERELSSAVRLSPSHALAHFELGKAFQRLGQQQDALTEFETAVKLDHTLATAQHALHTLRNHLKLS